MKLSMKRALPSKRDGMTKSTRSNLLAEKIPQAEKYVSELQKSLNLHHWRIRVTKDKPESTDNWMEVRLNRPRQMAQIRMSDNIMRETDENFNDSIKHEMLHLILEPLFEEVDMTLNHLELPPEREEEYRDRFRRQLEKAVEHLTYCTLK